MTITPHLDAIVCGRNLGKCSSIEEEDCIFLFEDFVPNADAQSAGLDSGTIWADFSLGEFVRYDDEGSISWSIDMIPILSKIERETEESK